MRPEILAIPGLMTETELRCLARLCKTLPDGVLLEIGTYRGRSAAVMCDVVGDSRVVSADNYEMDHHGENNISLARTNLSRLGFEPLLLHANSPLSTTFLDQHCLRIALLFLDGHHYPDTVRAELSRYVPYVPIHGVVACHDYSRSEYPGYSEAIDEFFDDRVEDWDGQEWVESLIAFRRLS